MIDITKVDFQKGNGLIPVIAQDNRTQKVLMLGFANEPALKHTLETGKLTFFSRSRNTIWTKGSESGNFLQVQSLSLDCDNDTILAKVLPDGPVCHTGQDTCWGDVNAASDMTFLLGLEALIANRKSQYNTNHSYVASLFAQGINKIAQKVGEEAVELVIEAKDQNPVLFLEEAADLLFHYMILLRAKEHTLSDVVSVLRKRHHEASNK